MKTEKRYIVRSYVMASSIEEAIQKGFKGGIEEAYIDTTYSEQKRVIGFKDNN